MPNVVFHRLAIQEFRKAREWYRAQSSLAAQRFIRTVAREIDRATKQFDALQLTIEGCRWTKVGRFPYLLIIHRDGPDDFFIVAVAHARRRPGYWRCRVS